ncbi:mesothelin-like protein [Oxyura jamaicensis]|uniref:mesothelin-like protein n=1 Tax=Oxyura jamaicensis TaxID=8884 RepID=UPI0015A6D411|nr:mesothelin-like protein [Oxyura jamaicensis]
MVLVAPALAAVVLGLRFSTGLAQAAPAALLFGTVLSATQPFADLPASVLQGFRCSQAHHLPAAAVLALTREMRNKSVELSSAQLSCLARLLAANNLTASFRGYPPDLLLFFDVAEVRGETCEEFYSLAARGNLELLPRGSAQRRAILHGALACVGASGSCLHPEQLGSLGALVCDMEPDTITASDPGILENLKLCPALTGAQRVALNAVLLGGGTAYGDPLGWDLQTLQSLGPLVLALNQTTLSLVAKATREAFARSIAATYSSQGWSQREKSLTLLSAFTAASAASHPRLKRSADRCMSKPITPSTLSEGLLLLDYDTPEQFYLCLSVLVLKSSLALVLEQPLTTGYLQMVKKKLQEIYPAGIPDDQLRLLGPLSRQYTAQEISQWQLTSSDTLCALLSPLDGPWSAAQKQQLIARYLELGGKLTGPLLQKIGGSCLCSLSEEQIEKVTPEAIGSAGELDVSSCSQSKKDQLYRTAREAFAGQAGTRAYYCQIRPYLGGAPVKDLKDLANAGINISIDTFLALNPNELQKLSVMDVKNLLGTEVQELKKAENQTAVLCWIKKQSQEELDRILGIGLHGGMEEPSPTGTTTLPHLNTSASIAPTTTVPTTTALLASPSPTATSSRPPTAPNTSPKTLTPNAVSPTLPTSTIPHASTPRPSTTVGPAATPTARPPLAPSSIAPCLIHQSATPKKTTTPAVTLLATILAATNPRATSPSSVPPPAATGSATPSTRGTNPAVSTHGTSTLLVPSNTPAPGGTTSPAPATHITTIPSTPGAPSALVPKSTSAPAAITATEMNLPHKPTPVPNTTVSTHKGGSSSTVKTTTFACKTAAPPALLGPSSTTSSSENTKKTPTGVPEPPKPTPGGYINLQPEPGSGSRLSSCLVHILTTAVGLSLLQRLL